MDDGNIVDYGCGTSDASDEGTVLVYYRYL